MSAPSSDDVDSDRHAGRAPSRATTGAPSTVYSTSPCWIAVFGGDDRRDGLRDPGRRRLVRSLPLAGAAPPVRGPAPPPPGAAPLHRRVTVTGVVVGRGVARLRGGAAGATGRRALGRVVVVVVAAGVVSGVVSAAWWPVGAVSVGGGACRAPASSSAPSWSSSRRATSVRIETAAAGSAAVLVEFVVEVVVRPVRTRTSNSNSSGPRCDAAPSASTTADRCRRCVSVVVRSPVLDRRGLEDRRRGFGAVVGVGLRATIATAAAARQGQQRRHRHHDPTAAYDDVEWMQPCQLPRSASVGGRRAARAAGYRPAMAPIASAAIDAAADRDRRDDDLPVLGRCVDRGHGCAEPDADDAAGSGEQDRLRQELPADVRLASPRAHGAVRSRCGARSPRSPSRWRCRCRRRAARPRRARGTAR